MDSQNRLLIAVVLSILILLVYQRFYVAPHVKKLQERGVEEVRENHIITVSPEEKPLFEKERPSAVATETQHPGATEEVTLLENEVFKIGTTDYGARIKQIWLKKFEDSPTNKPTQLLNPKTTEEIFTGPFLLEDLFLENPALENWKLIDKTDRHVKYSFKPTGGAVITKEIFLHNSSYAIGLRLNIKNATTIAMPVKYKLVGASALFIRPGMDERYVGTDIKIGQEATRLNNPRRHLKNGGKIYYESPSWISTRGRYFSLAIEPGQKEQACFVEKEGEKGVRSGIIVGPITIMPQDTVAREFLLYAGPNDTEELKKASSNLVDVATFGKLNAICMVLLKLLRFFNSLMNNYGISIIMVTLVVSGALFPLTKKSLKSMKEMQTIQPEIQRLEREYKNNPQKLNREKMELFKRHKINPLGGCLPMFFQMPVFIALYQVLIKSVELKGANFLWIKDLSEPDAAFKLSAALPILGEYINILPILMAIAMFLQQKIAQPKTTQSEQQRMMAIMMPLLFGVIFYNLPSGLVLYWLTNTVIMVLLQEFILKLRHTNPEIA